MNRTARATGYDEVPYADDPYPSSHPGHLAVVAILAGLTPPPVGRCRVLELGCARGGNLIPMAVGLPGSSFVGIDSSAGQVAAANSVVDALGLDNVAIRHRDILDVGDELGTFDYIICHGTYSWVPAEVRDKILEISARNLSPGGVAYLGYNTQPGWRLRGLARDLMDYHARRFERPEERAREARRVLGFMASAATPFDRAYANWLGEEFEYLRGRPDSYLLHDHLEAVNEPVYFHELAGLAAAKGLRYVSEVQAGVLAPEGLPPGVAAGLRQLAADDVEFEQFLDFLINRKFRQSVFSHAGRSPGRGPRREDLAGLDVAAAGPGPAPLPPVAFRDGRLLRAAIEHLAAAWPSAVGWESLPGLARARVDPPRRDGHVAEIPGDEALASDLISCYKLKLVEFRAYKPPFVLEIGERPVASPLARYQAGFGTTVTNLRHEAGRLNEFSRIVLHHLDGSRDRAAILEVLHQSRNEGRLELSGAPSDLVDGLSLGPREASEQALGAMLDRSLEKLARFALLMG